MDSVGVEEMREKKIAQIAIIRTASFAFVRRAGRRSADGTISYGQTSSR